MVSTINSIAVCGAGTMGCGIAQCAAQNGFYTILFDVSETTLEKAKNSIEKSLANLVAKQKITEADKESIQKRICFVNDIQECIADVIIEAIIEKTEAKIALFNQLAEINHGETIFASNTSSLSITAIAEAVLRPQRVVGMHFFNPATIMKLVEVVQTTFTDAKAIATIMELCKQLHKTPVLCKDAPGFIVNRVARHYYLEALLLAEAEKVDYETIDSLLESVGFKMGAFKLMDLIGNDINFAVTESLYNACNHSIRFAPSALHAQIVQEGKLGIKTKEGFYKYD